MRSHGSLKSDAEANAAATEALRGVGIGAIRWSAPMLLLSGIGQVTSPIYRGLTIQFKVFLVMGGMVVGGWIEGDRRLRRYEEWMRMQRRIVRDQAELARYEIEEAKEVARELDRKAREARDKPSRVGQR